MASGFSFFNIYYDICGGGNYSSTGNCGRGSIADDVCIVDTVYVVESR